MFPPRARGSSHFESWVDGIPAVSPACAGIVPGSIVPSVSIGCFPRVRGDRPPETRRRRSILSFPPRARGSSLLAEAKRSDVVVSPACAGIVPAYNKVHQGLERFPRVRGDRPSPPPPKNVAIRFPPRARGSSRRGLRRVGRGAVSPACAGIVPRRSSCSFATSSFPRVRGDRPVLLWWPFSGAVFPPRARGSSHPQRSCSSPTDVSPACAGIVPLLVRYIAHLRSFPRVRGDRPREIALELREWAFPPRARGSSPVALDRREPLQVSPACAGIVLGVANLGELLPGFPRVRGDRPSEHCL